MMGRGLKWLGALIAWAVLAGPLHSVPARAAVETPSFPCSAARLPSERTICDAPRLAALDTAMVALYEALEGTLDRTARQELRGSQNAWRAARDACLYRRNCIARSYAARIDALRAALVPGMGRASIGADERRAIEQEARASERARIEREMQREEQKRLEEQARLDAARRERRSGLSTERRSRASGYCSDFVDRERVNEIACMAEIVRRCDGVGRRAACVDEQRFTNRDGRTITLTLEGERVLLNGERALRFGRDCVRERGGLYGFCFSTTRGARMPERADPRPRPTNPSQPPSSSRPPDLPRLGGRGG